MKGICLKFSCYFCLVFFFFEKFNASYNGCNNSPNPTLQIGPHTQNVWNAATTKTALNWTIYYIKRTILHEKKTNNITLNLDCSPVLQHQLAAECKPLHLCSTLKLGSMHKNAHRIKRAWEGRENESVQDTMYRGGKSQTAMATTVTRACPN